MIHSLTRIQMRSLPILLLALVVIAGCRSEASDESAAMDGVPYGAPIEAAAFRTADDVLASADELDGANVAVEGTIREVCQNKGCWFILESENEPMLRVHVPRDEEGAYVFTLPKDISGQQVLVEGRLFEKELSDAEQAHYTGEAETPAPAREYRIEASGVMIRGAGA